MAQSFADYPNITNPDCAWTPLREWGGLPNVKWCEETLCSVIAEPANTWSNLAYLFVAVGLYFYTRRDTNRTLRFWAPAAFLVGITSLVYHATVAFVTQVLDFWGMYFFFALVLLLNLLRMGKLAKETFFRTLYVTIFSLTALTVAIARMHLPVQGIVGVMIVLILITETLASRGASTPINHKWLAASLFFIAVAAGFSASDASGMRCDPKDHVFQGHAIWHVFGSISLGLAHFHYRQFVALFR
jgi:Ceramidase